MKVRMLASANAVKIFRSAVCFLLLLSLFLALPVPSFAADDGEHRIVRVGYMDFSNFIEKNDDGDFYGYGVEYLNDICKYTGWEIEYVHAPWYEQLNMLERGELDIVPLAQYTEERAERFLFTHQPIGIIQGLLLIPSEGQTEVENNALVCNGKTIGILRESRNIELLAQYAEHMGFTYKLKQYDYQSDLENALLAGEVDIVACEQMIKSSDLCILDRFASDPHYFITSRDNTELMDELDYVISKLNAYDPTYTADLYRKHFGKGFLSSRPYFTNEETEFLASCGEVTVAIIPESKPMIYVDEDGEAAGIFPDIMGWISELSGIKFSYVFIPQDRTPLAFIKENPTYIASGVMANNPAFAAPDILVSDVYYTSYSALTSHIKYEDRFEPGIGAHTIGIPASFQAMRLFLQKNYPNLTIVDYVNVEDGLQALEDREIDYFSYIHNIIMPYLSNPRYADVSIVDNQFMPNLHCSIALNTPENQLLINIIDKCVAQIPKEALAVIESEHLQKSLYQFDQSDVLHRYQDVLLITALLIVGIFALLVTLQLIRQRKYTKEINLHAEYDMMTGVFNRATMLVKAQELLDRNADRGCAVLIADLDDLKRINDTRGRDAGDEAIKTVARILTSQFRESAVIGRVGGDGFGVLLSGVGSKTVLVPLLAKLHKTITTTAVANGTAVLSASIGVSMGAAGKESLDELVRRAEEALARVKANGKNGFSFYESQKSISLKAEAQIESGEDAGEAALQPISDSLPQAVPEQGSDSITPPADRDANYRKLLDAFPNVGVYVIEQATHKMLYYNRCFKEICPNAHIGITCRNLMFGPCQNCIVDTMGEQKMAHAIFYSDYFGDEVEVTAVKVMWENEIPAVMISSWPRDFLTSSSASLPGISNQDMLDYVTGGLTRAGFIRMMARMQKGGVDLTEYTVVFLNIKDFKAVNEMAGSAGGDNLLRTVFSRIEQSKLHPIIGSRKESDHFIFLVEKSKLNLSELPELLDFHWKYDGKDLFIHCRSGIFHIDDNTLEIYKMIDRAKLAKEHIVDDYVQPYAVYEQSMLDEYSDNASAFLLFDNGIKNNEFVVFYQPIIDAKTEKIISAEALVRQKTADGTIISPGRFIPILERTGYISMLDRFVSEEVEMFLTDRMDNGLPNVPISFNLSQKDFYDSDLMDFLAASLENSTLPKGFVMLELTESAYTLHEKKHEDYLKRLRASGAKILLDDFGSGYSSFGMFENYNFDRVKLDMSFVRQLSGNENVKLVVESIISMCHKLGVQVVAEGVETAEELSILREMDCDLIQGYYFSKPLDEHGFVEYLAAHL